MEGNNHEFDSTLGGSERLPHSANSFKFSAARSVEIAAMTESILRPSHTKLIFQTLPVHMRRRVMSHNCKRLPRKLRQGHFEQLKKSGLPPKQKRPSRKYRRRPTDLLQEYRRRQRVNAWLETHIWHAKRFHMVERWGYRLPRAPCDKAFRACYRASSAHCLLQDLSYLRCLQICGDFSEIDSGFKTMSGSGLGLCAKAYSSGSREGSVHMYRPNSYPHHYIGEVSFLWKPSCESEKRTLWMFVHPAFFRQFYDAVLEIFKIPNDDEYAVPEKKPRCEKIYISNKTIEISELSPKLNRFRLTGPRSHAVLVRSLKFIDDEDIAKVTAWGQQNDADLKLKNKWCYWDRLQHLSSPAELPSHLVLGAVVRDPRLSRPPKRTKAQVDTYSPVASDTLINIPEYARISPLWDTTLHGTILSNKWSDGQLIEHATKHQLIPGESDESNPNIQSVPVILIQRPGSQCPKVKKLGYGSGWDIILPAGYGLPFWRTFIMFGGRAGGLRETESMARESACCYFPPDSEAGLAEEQRIYHETREKYFRLPPNKRVNYIKLGINSPFQCRWSILLKDWCNGFDGRVYVARDKALLKDCQISIERKKIAPALELCQPCLIPVFVQVTGKGNLASHALICLPEPGDIKNAKTLSEPCHVDTCEKERKLMRKENRAKLKKMRRQRIKLKKRTAFVPQPKRRVENPKLSEYALKMRELWLPSVRSVRKSCSREALGYVLQAGFSLTEARSTGVGYVASAALRELLRVGGEGTVLVRNNTSRKYRTAKISVILSP